MQYEFQPEPFASQVDGGDLQFGFAGECAVFFFLPLSLLLASAVVRSLTFYYYALTRVSLSQLKLVGSVRVTFLDVVRLYR